MSTEELIVVENLLEEASENHEILDIKEEYSESPDSYQIEEPVVT